MREVTVGLDIGTTSVKAVAADADGRVVARARVPHELLLPRPDALEHDAGAAWRDGPRSALAALAVGGPAGVCVAAMVPSVTAVDASGAPFTAGLLYGDARGRVAPPSSDGLGAHPAASGEGEAFVRWAVREAPDAAGYWPAQAVANHAVGGEAVVDAGTAASLYPLATGLGWDAGRVAGAGARPEQLPRIAGIGEAAGGAGGVVLASGLVDAVGEQLVAGADEPGDVLVVLGATLLVWAVVPEWREVRGLWCVPHTAPGRFLLGGASNAGGLFLDWAQRLLGPVADRPDPDRVPVWEPYPRGERTPLHDPERRAAVHGLDLTHGPAAVLRAAFEASGFVVRRHLELAGVEPRRIVASGGGSRIGGWVAAIADATGSPVDTVAVPEGGALGAAFVARVAAGLETELAAASRWARTATTVRPDPAWRRAVERRYRRFLELSAAEAGPRSRDR